MKFFLFLLLFFTTFKSFSGAYYFGGLTNSYWRYSAGGLAAGDICGGSPEQCVANLPVLQTATHGVYYDYEPTSSFSYDANSQRYSVVYKRVDINKSSTLYFSFTQKEIDDEVCSSSSECYALSVLDCSTAGQVLSDFEYIDKGNYTYSCSDGPPNAEDLCKQKVTEACVNNFWLGSFSFVDLGNGSTSCDGVCTDGTPLNDIDIPEECTLSNNYCDVAENPSDLDFSGGGTGSSVGDSTTTTTADSDDVEHLIDYTPDGSTSDNLTGMSTLQGDKLINEVVKTRNDNTTNLVETTKNTNAVIVEKSDDISQTVSNAGNGIIDAVNGIAPFYDGNIVNAIDNLSESIGDKLTGNSESFYTGIEGHEIDTLFNEPSSHSYNMQTAVLRSEIDQLMTDYKGNLLSNFSFTSHTNGYQANTLDLVGWGSFDISMARFSDYFGGVGNVIYLLASLTALTILLGGGKT